MDIKKLSKKYQIRHLIEEEAPMILNLLNGNPVFFKHCPPSPSIKSIKEDMKVLPPNTEYTNKHYIGYFKGKELICIMDLIDKYPLSSMAFIGFFMINAKYQRKHIGSSIISELKSYFKEIKYSEIRLGYMASNIHSKRFWEKNGFRPIGDIKKFKNKDVIVLTCKL